MSSVRRGNAAENAVRELHEQRGWIAGGRRHLCGAGDWLFVHPRQRMRLVEVKATARAFSGFGPADRSALLALADELDADALLAYVPNPFADKPTVRLIPPGEWPSS